MLRSALVFFFQIHDPQPIKGLWVALTLLNIALMLALAWRSAWPFRVYLVVMAACATLQNSLKWNLAGEIILAAFTALWIAGMLPRDRRGKVEALAMGAFVAFVLMFLVPDPWPNYPASMYFTRMYSSAACLGAAVACAFEDRRNAIATPWFGAVLLAQSQRGWDIWKVAIIANVTWTVCLLAWLWFTKSDSKECLPDAQVCR